MATNYHFPGSAEFRVRTGDVVHIYTDAGATTLAVIKNLLNVVIAGSALTVPTDETLPPFTATVPDVYAKIVGAASARHLHADTSAGPIAATVAYDNATSGLTATTLQAAIDELVVRLVALE